MKSMIYFGYGINANADTPDVAEEIEVEYEERLETPWRVILFNDNIHTFDEVIVQLQKATGCSEARGEALAWQVHTEGKACVYEGDFFDCFRVQGILSEIQLVTELQG